MPQSRITLVSRLARSGLAGALVLLAAALLATAPPATAQGINTQFLIGRIDRVTPKCRDHPNAPWVGRVSGVITGVPTRGVSFQGCFDTRRECEAWRRLVSGQVSGRLTQNRCERR
jgi:hypothetical protein